LQADDFQIPPHRQAVTVICYFMRTFIIIFIVFVTTNSFAQKEEAKFFCKEVGWTVVFPNGFAFDSAFGEQMMKDGIKAVEETNNVKANITQTKILFNVFKNKWNNINATITFFDSSKQGNYKTFRQGANDALYKSYLDGIPDSKIDSIDAILTIAGLTFDSFHLTVYKREKLLFDTYLLSKFYKDYDFTISYLYIDSKIKAEVEAMLRNSKFLK